MSGQIMIFGAGGLGREVFAAIQEASSVIAGFLVEPGYPVGHVAGLSVVDSPATWIGKGSLVVAIGDNRTRARIVSWLGTEAHYVCARHPSAVLGPRVSLGAGSMLVGPLSVTVDVCIGTHVLLNPGVTIAHDCEIGPFVSLGPRVALAGGVIIDEGAALGVGAVVAPRCRVGAWAIVGAGAVVVEDVPAGATVTGVPARIVRTSQVVPSPSQA